ncbi:MarR family transcriptional regulator [Sphingobium sp. AN641]|uniref:MarR family transcriptional regulator n=1 Tax=Sphingobium sp. AN641 TaxID=3133443 RepID=UPI0030C390FF
MSETGFGTTQDAAHDYAASLPGARPGMLLIADEGNHQAITALADAAGYRLQGAVPVAQGSGRLDLQMRCDLVLLMCDTPDAALERLLGRLESLAGMGEVALIVVATVEALDLAYATVRSGRVQLLCEPDIADLAAALVAARDDQARASVVYEQSPEAERLRQLSEEVARLARTLEAMTGARSPAKPSFPLDGKLSDRPSDYIGMPAPVSPMGHDAPPSPLRDISGGQVRDLLRARRMRADFLPGELFADPAWDMLLDLLAARLDGERVSVSSLCIAAAVPPTTALRWIRTLTDQALVVRHADPLDGRRVFIQLADHAAESLGRWFASTRRLIVGAVGA